MDRANSLIYYALSSVNDIAHCVVGSPDSSRVLNRFRYLVKSKKAVPSVSALSAVLNALRHPQVPLRVDDRKFLLQQTLALLSMLPDSAESRELNNQAVELLFDDIVHMPSSTLASGFNFRAADGAWNSLLLPNLGRAGQAYYRSVQQSTAPIAFERPDPGLVFDVLLRRDQFREHPAGLSSFFFAFAALLVHSIFRTGHENPNTNETTSYLDLAVLYGSNQDEQNSVRRKEGRGFLLPDCYPEQRILLLPPAVSALVVLFNRNHNCIAEKLLAINEDGFWTNPDLILNEEQRMEQDEQIFQTARLCNCGWFASILFSDYLSTVLGLDRAGRTWAAKPLAEIRKEDHSILDRGRGNSCAVEFNLLYHWHATTSKQDEDWVEMLFQQMFGSAHRENLTRRDFIDAFDKMVLDRGSPHSWTFADLQRASNGFFRDGDLASIIRDAINNPAASFGARGTPQVLRSIEIMALEQARHWGVCTMNDFRKLLGLKPFSSFREWNSDPKIADAAERLYGDIDQLELYPGLQAEESTPLMQGASLCPGFTIGRAILSDIVNLVRGDRFLTVDFLPANLTDWGFADCQIDPDGFGCGSTFGRLLLRTLPRNFSSNSVHAFFPFTRPNVMERHLKELNVLDQYDFSYYPPTKQPVHVLDYGHIVDILWSPYFEPPYGARAEKVIQGKGFFTAESKTEQEKVLEILDNSPDIVEPLSAYLSKKIQELTEESSYSLVGGCIKSVDLVRDVVTVAPMFIAAEQLGGFQLKTKHTPMGIYTPQELFTILSDLYTYIFFDVEPARDAALEQKVKNSAAELLGKIKQHMLVTLPQQVSIEAFKQLFSTVTGMNPRVKDHDAIVHRLCALSRDPDYLANTILALMVGLSMELTLVMTNALNLFMDGEYGPQFREYAEIPSSEYPYRMMLTETLRLDPPHRMVRRIAKTDQRVQQKAGILTFTPKDIALLDIAHAHRNEVVFKEPNDLTLTRPAAWLLRSEIAFRWNHPGLAGRLINEALGTIGRLPNLRRGPGQSGTLRRFVDPFRKDLTYAYLDRHNLSCAWPTSLVVQFSGSSSSR